MNYTKRLKPTPFIYFTFILWLSVSCSMFLAYRNEWQTIESTTLDLFCGALYCAMTLALGFIFYMLYKSRTIEWIFVGFTLIMGFIQLFSIPISALPDSNSHLVTVYGQSSELLGIEAYDKDGNIIVHSDVYWNTGLTWYATKEDYVFYLRGIFEEPEAIQEEMITRTPLDTRHPGYLPQILGVSFARIIGMNPVQVIHMGRIFALFFYCFIMYWAIKKIPFGKTALFILGSLPMTLQQAVSYNYDSVLNGMCLLAISWLLYLIYEADKIKKIDILILVIATISIATIKFIYLPILGLGLLIPKEKFGGTRKKLYCTTGIIILGIAALLFSKLTFLQGEVASSLTSMGKPSISLSWILQNPATTIGILYRTVERYVSLWLDGLVASPLGYFDDGIAIPSAIVISLWIIILLSNLPVKDSTSKIVSFNIFEKLWLTFIIGIVSLFIMVAILCDTPIGAASIWGVQGRYFLPLMPIFLLLINNDCILLKKNIDKYLLVSLGYLNCMTIFYYTLAVVSA